MKRRGFDATMRASALLGVLLLTYSCSSNYWHPPDAISFVTPVNLCEAKDWNLRFGLPSGYYFFSMYFVLPDKEQTPHQASTRLDLEYKLVLMDGLKESGKFSIDISPSDPWPAPVSEIRPNDESALKLWQSGKDSWPWYAIVHDPPRRVLRYPLGIALHPDDLNPKGVFTIRILNANDVPDYLCEADLRVDTYLGT